MNPQNSDKNTQCNTSHSNAAKPRRQIFNIYCDETRVENPDSNNMVIGAIVIPRKEKDPIVEKIKKIQNNHSFAYEIKWTKVSEKYLPFYQEVIDHFSDSPILSYRCIIVDKKKVKLAEYHKDDPELAFFKFYYFMLKNRLVDGREYYIFLDKKPTRDKNIARALFHFLEGYAALRREECRIVHLQAYPSHENILLQLTDLITGIIGYEANKSDEKLTPKAKLASYLKQKLSKQSLIVTSRPWEEKFNVFCWEPRNA